MATIATYLARQLAERNAQQTAAADRRRGLRDRQDRQIDAAENYDASAALDQTARGTWGGISEMLQRELRNLGGSAVRAGRFDSGFYDEDQGEVFNTATRQFGDALARQSLDAEALEMRSRETAMEGIAAQREEEENAFREEQERKRRRRGGIGSAIGGLLGGVGGFFVGGPAGAAAGAKLGSGLGGAVASY